MRKYVYRSDGSVSSIPQDEIINFNYIATSVDSWVFVADADYEVVAVKLIPSVAGNDASAVTADIMKASGTTAVASGTTVLSAADSLNLKGTAHTLQTGTLSATQSARQITSGDRLGINFTGTLTSAVGLIQVSLKRIQAAGSTI
jgi:hypothetical protein